MREWLSKYVDTFRRRAERKSFDRGHEWGKHALASGTYTADEIEAFALGTFNRCPNERAFDRGVSDAVSEARNA